MTNHRKLVLYHKPHLYSWSRPLLKSPNLIYTDYYSIKKERDIQEIENVLSIEEARTMLKKITNEEVHLFTLVGLTCGTRSGESLDLNVNGIDFKRGMWKIHHQYQYLGKGKGYGSTPKLKTKTLTVMSLSRLLHSKPSKIILFELWKALTLGLAPALFRQKLMQRIKI